MADHAVLSPSAASRWLICTKSARYEQQFAKGSSVYADEGTFAHALGELLIRFKVRWIDEAQYKAALKKLIDKDAVVTRKHKAPFYSVALHEYCDAYANMVVSKYWAYKAADPATILLLEQKLSIDEYVPECFGHVDALIVTSTLLDVNDFKFGKGVEVSAEKNKQLMLYALGAYQLYTLWHDFTHVNLTIYQPRLENHSEYKLSIAELLDWAINVVKPQAQLAFNGEGVFIAGEHCRFCAGKVLCTTLAKYADEVAAITFDDDLPDVNSLSDEKVSFILSRMKVVTNWLTAVNKYAETEALKGKRWPGMKLVRGRSNRVYKNDKDVIQHLLSKGYKLEHITKQSVLPITEMEARIGKNEFFHELDAFVIKPKGKPALVPVSDKREEFIPTAEAADEFDDGFDDENEFSVEDIL